MGKKSHRQRGHVATAPPATSAATTVDSNTATNTGDSTVSEGTRRVREALFDNPMVQAANAALSPEEKERFRIMGEHMFNNVDFETNQALNNLPAHMVEPLAHLVCQIQSGLHPSAMDIHEKRLLAEGYGKEWYTRWGYTEADLTDIVTTEPDLSQAI